MGKFKRAASVALDVVCTLATAGLYSATLPFHTELVDGNKVYPNLDEWACERVAAGKAISAAIRRDILGRRS